MVMMENECCCCATENYPCAGSACPNRNVPHLYCDECEEEVEDLYKTEDGELCAECVLKMFEKVEVD